MTAAEFENIYRTFYRRMYVYAHDFVVDREACNDIVADVFMALWDMRDRIDRSTVEAYLRTSVRNACFHYFRRQRNNEAFSEYFKLTVEEVDSLDSIDERVDDLMNAIDSLPDRTRYILEQCYLHDKTYKEVAAQEGITDSGVKKHIVKAYSSIREYFRGLKGKTDTETPKN